MKKVSVFTALLCMALVSGCAVGPTFHRPPAPHDAGYAPAELPQTTAAANIRGGSAQRFVPGGELPFEWWREFRSPVLDDLVARAFRANPTIPAAQAALRQAQESVSAQRGFFFPTIDA